MIRSFIYYFFSLIIFFSYVAGFYYLENSSGQAGDSIHIFNNYQLFQKYNLNNLPWMEYGSSSLPLYYLITSSFFDFKNVFSLRMFNLIIAISSFFIFYQILVNKFKKNKIFTNSQIVLLSSLIFLSPYFRTATFYGMEETTGIFFFLISIYLFKLYKKNNKNLTLFLCIFCSCLCFYSRQSYLFLLVVFYFNLINLEKLIVKKNILISLTFVIFLIPSLYIFSIWGGIHTPAAVEVSSRNEYLQIHNLPFILNIILIYLIPFIFLIFDSFKEFYRFLFAKILLLIVFFIINLIILSTNEIQWVGGGAFSKLILITIKSEALYLVLYSLLASLSLVLIYEISIKVNILLFFFILITLTFLNINLVFQEYFDPLILILLMSFFDFSKINKNKFINFPLFMGSYYLVFLVSSLFYYYKVV